jgi:hypothetical protein
MVLGIIGPGSIRLTLLIWIAAEKRLNRPNEFTIRDLTDRVDRPADLNTRELERGTGDINGRVDQLPVRLSLCQLLSQSTQLLYETASR